MIDHYQVNINRLTLLGMYVIWTWPLELYIIWTWPLEMYIIWTWPLGMYIIWTWPLGMYVIWTWPLEMYVIGTLLCKDKFSWLGPFLCNDTLIKHVWSVNDSQICHSDHDQFFSYTWFSSPKKTKKTVEWYNWNIVGVVGHLHL